MKNTFLTKIKIFLPYINQYKKFLIIGVILKIVWSLGTLIGGYLNGQAVQFLTEGDLKWCIILLITYFFVDCALAVIGQSSGFILSKYQLYIARRSSFDIIQKVFKLPTLAFEKMSSGEIINRVSGDAEEIINTIDKLTTLLSYFLMFGFLFGYVFVNSWIVGVEIVGYSIIFGVFIYFFNKKFKKAREEVKTNSDSNLSMQTESFRGIREIRSLGINPPILTTIKEKIQNLTNSNVKESRLSAIYIAIVLFLMTAVEVGVFVTCAILVAKGKAPLSFFITMTIYVYRCMGIANMCSEFAKGITTLNVSLKRINEITNNEKYKDIEYGDKTIENPVGEVAFENVKFKYEDNDNDVINDLTCVFEPNKKIAVVGPSGNGKSTIFNLITRLFDITEGKILIDGVDVKDLTEESLRDMVAVVRQEPFFFNKTIKENLLLVAPNATDEEIRDRCKQAYIDDYIMGLPNQYDTVLGEGGTNLSGGQKQRLSIARTLLKKSQIILFDEATSALDNESQEYIKKTINDLVKTKTIIIIAHRLSTIIDADKIYVMNKGQFIASGTHEELMTNCGIYRNLYQIEI